MASANQSSISLTNLLPSTTYSLAYAIPLLLTSLLLAFAGAFLTLDRTRSFAPRGAPMQMPGAPFDVKRRKRPRFYLEGGLGGISLGWAFGLHLSTFLALVIPNESTAASLSSKAFVVVWFLSALPTAILAGRFKYVTLALAGIVGGAALSLGLSISIHPSLLTRRIFLALFAALLPILTLLPFRTQHASVRFAAASTGSFGLMISFALFSGVTSWANPWERLWISDNAGWGTGKEHALSAGFWLVLCAGCVSDWALHRFYGGNPDEKWDSYLAEYAATLPLAPNRAGVFTPLTHSFWERLFPWLHSGPPADKNEVSFPLTGAHDVKLPASPRTSFPSEKAPFEYQEPPRMLRKQSTKPRALQGRKPKREAIKFDALRTDDLSSDSDEEGTTLHDHLSTPPRRPSLSTPPPRPLSSASRTLTNDSSASKSRASKRAKSDAPEYSDFEEEDVTALAPAPEPWAPPFLVRGRSQREATGSAGAGAVPLTPSLMHALHRVKAAQVQALGGDPTGMPAPSLGAALVQEQPPQEGERKGGERWEDFWRDVKAKAGEGLRR
ncbi:hypothetical protein BV25DRAFT_1916620 [Artomyces pyxidatus]|uniref:Uncharacterized protein n=1 Tax=Artomyces pyxidatus TaxID=48021 RepID=A0ACB8SZP4_9AGAM|nr:hypothetical protein BV25DRAFT_1916620 [Artomyces pyxidatus]